MLGFVGLFSANGSCRFDSGEFLPYYLLLFSCLMRINIAHEICRRLTTFEVLSDRGCIQDRATRDTEILV